MENGRLQRVPGDYSLPPADRHALYPAARQLPGKVRRFVDFLLEHFTGGADAKPVPPA